MPATESNDGSARRDPAPEAALIRRVKRNVLHMLQKHFAELGQVTVCICTIEGRLITPPSWGSRYSELIGTSPLGQQTFAKSVRECVLDPRRKVPTKCHEGMTLHASPIVHDGNPIGVIVAGSRSCDPLQRPAVKKVAAMFDLDPDDLWQSAATVGPYSGGSPEAIHRFADVLGQTIATLYGQADRIERQLDELRTVHSFTELLTGTLELESILDLTVTRVVEVMDVKACAIRLLDTEKVELTIKAVCNLSQEYLQKGPVLVRDNLIDATAIAGEAVHILDVQNDPRIRYPENARREGIVSGLCVPLNYRGEIIGVIRVYTARPHRFNESEVSLLRSIGSQAAAAVITSGLWAQHAAGEKFQRQVDAAAAIQSRMLPDQAPELEGAEIGCVYEPTLQLGGDFYDFIRFDDRHLAICVADVVGKGLPAALLMASTRSAIRAYAGPSTPVETVVERVNRHMFTDTLTGEFATLVWCVLSRCDRETATDVGNAAHAAAASWTLTYCNAGHNPPLLLRGEDFTELEVGGLVIGVRADETYQRGEVVLHSGDVVVMFTDGVTEAMNFEGDEYGHDRLLASIRKHRDLDAQQLARQILWDVRRYVGLADQSDDITIVVLKIY